MIIVKPKATLWSITPNAAQLIERCGRICYKSEDRITADSAGKFIKMLIDRGHLSVLEHAHATIHFICDRGVTHEMVRHRLAAYSQESTRYCNYGKDKFDGQITVIQPPCTTEEGDKAWLASVEQAEADYLYMTQKGESPQIARSVLPNSLKTEIAMTCNFREWLHVFDLRISDKAHPQIKEVMLIAKGLLQDACPEVF